MGPMGPKEWDFYAKSYFPLRGGARWVLVIECMHRHTLIASAIQVPIANCDMFPVKSLLERASVRKLPCTVRYWLRSELAASRVSYRTGIRQL